MIEHALPGAIEGPKADLAIPDATLSLSEDVTAYWTGADVALILSEDAYLPTGDKQASVHGERSLDAVRVLRMVATGSALWQRRVEEFRSAWRAWTNNPSHFGARPANNPRQPRAEVASWIASDITAGRVLEGSTLGTPYLRFSEDRWRLHLDGLERRHLAEVAWQDAPGLQEVTNMLSNVDYWTAAAALAFPDEWKRAKAQARSKLASARERAEKERLAREAAAAYAEPEMGTSTRVVARLLRSFRWNSDADHFFVRSVDMKHCDLSTPSGTVRAAELLSVSWARNVAVAQRRELVARLKDHLSQRGYDAVLTRSGNILVCRDKDTLVQHLSTVMRACSGYRVMTIY